MPDGDDFVRVGVDNGGGIGSGITTTEGSPPPEATVAVSTPAAAMVTDLSAVQLQQIVDRVTASASQAWAATFQQFQVQITKQVQDKLDGQTPQGAPDDNAGTGAMAPARLGWWKETRWGRRNICPRWCRCGWFAAVW